MVGKYSHRLRWHPFNVCTYLFNDIKRFMWCQFFFNKHALPLELALIWVKRQECDAQIVTLFSRYDYFILKICLLYSQDMITLFSIFVYFILKICLLYSQDMITLFSRFVYFILEIYLCTCWRVNMKVF